MKIVALIFVFLGIIFWEVPRLVKERMWKELGVFLLVLLAGACFSFGLVLDIPVPNPTHILEKMFIPK